MAAQCSPQQKVRLKQEVFDAAGEGRVEDLCSALSGLSPTLVKEVLHDYTRDFGRNVTPLSTACERGHLEVVQLLVERFNVDVNQRVSAQGFDVMDVSPLMCASQNGHLDVVKVLVRKGCSLSLADGKKRTALFLACERDHLDVVEYLVENGACIEDGDTYGCTCLMVACHKVSEKLVKYLLERGAIVNKVTENRDTALHLAARRNAVQVVELLLKNGASLTKNSRDYSPLLEAAINCSIDVVSFCVQLATINRKEKIDGLELLGAMMAKQDMNAAFSFLSQAMKLRYEDPREILQTPRSFFPGLNRRVESCTLEELEAKQADPRQLRLECLAIAGRILGPRNADLVNYIFEHIQQSMNSGHFHEALTSSVYALHVTKEFENMCLKMHILQGISCVFSSMLQNSLSPTFSSVCEALELSLGVLQQNKPASQEDFRLSEGFAGLCLLCISEGLQVAESEGQKGLLWKLTKFLIQLQPSPFWNGSVLHAALSTQWDSLRSDVPVEHLRVESLVSFLVRCGANVNAVDRNGNRPLHILASCPPGYFNAETLCNLTHTLVDAGAHVDVGNREGKSALDMVRTETMGVVLRTFYPVSLKSLAARAVVKHRIPYDEDTSKTFEEYLH